MDNEKKLNILNYEEALEILADRIDFGPVEMTREQKKATLYSFVDYTARL